MRNFEKNKLKELGYDLYEIKCNPNLYYEISAHTDIHCCKINENIISTSEISIKNSITGLSTLSNKYPYDIPYNICIVGNLAIHNFKYTDKRILELLDRNNFIKTHINQGYSKCSIAVIDEKSIIVTDKNIFKILSNYDLDILLIDEALTKKIHLYKNEKLEYSSMNGFIGGVISRIDDFVFVSGDLNHIDFDNKIRNFIEKRNLKIIDFPNMDLIDYGGVLKI